MPTSSKRYICIHGHFYQPPRENPWLEAVETQDSAAPYHDWNERVCAECYAPNGAARIVNVKNKITRIVNNYARISFNFGPTLLSWLETEANRTWKMILDGDRRSRRSQKGHSSAMAQVYNHIIMPLANRRDKITQIRWGIADYVHRYGAPPEGMWLAETAANSETLELLAEHGIKFTVLAPRQCRRVRPLADSQPGGASPSWTPTPNDSVDSTRPYLVRFPSGASIAVFFYNGAVSQAIAFEGLLNSGEIFAARLKDAFRTNYPGEGDRPQLVHVATDGESYGHHHKHGEMALAYTLKLLEQDKTVRVTNYANYLALFPPDYECEIEENTSWSCIHGVERWRSNCGCNTGRPGWGQAWRFPLRTAMDEVRDAIAPLTEELGAKLFKDVWAARDAYISVLLDRKEETVNRFLAEHTTHPLGGEDRVRALKLMEMQRHAQLMYTSCGWFFDDISGIESVQVIAYAARVLQLAQHLFGERGAAIESAFVAQLSEAGSNLQKPRDGAQIYRDVIGPMKLTLEQVAAHYAISSMFTSYAEEDKLYSYRIRRISDDIYGSGRSKLAVGIVHVSSAITEDAQEFWFAVLHFGDQNITAAVKPYSEADADAFTSFRDEAAAYFQRADIPSGVRLLDRTFEHVDYSLKSLFADDQQRIIRTILKNTLNDIEENLTTIYEDHASLLHYLSQAGLPKPQALTLAAGFAVNAGLRRALDTDPVDVVLLRSYMKLAKADQVELDKPTLSYIADQRMKRVMVDLQGVPWSLETLDRALALARALTELPFDLNLWQAQNIWYEILRRRDEVLVPLNADDRARWQQDFAALGACLSIDTQAIVEQDPAVATTGD